MLISLSQLNLPSYSGGYSFVTPLVNFISKDQISRIKDFVLLIFSKFYTFCRQLSNSSNQISVKTMAMISCVSLIAILVISILRHRDVRIVPPATPNGSFVNA